MPIYQYCWRCQTEVAMLDEAEWAQLEPMLSKYLHQLKQYRQETGASQEVAVRQGFDKEVLNFWQQLTGAREPNVMALWHHRASLHGPPCAECGKPLRTPLARICASCGTFREIM